jgi:hypothetical protein
VSNDAKGATDNVIDVKKKHLKTAAKESWAFTSNPFSRLHPSIKPGKLNKKEDQEKRGLKLSMSIYLSI